MNKAILLIIWCALLTVPGLAQNLQPAKSCSLTGTWYGGGDYKYLLTITPNVDGTFAMRGEGAYNNAAIGYAGWTSFSSQLISVGSRRYMGQGIALYTTSTDPLPPADSYELDAIRSWANLVDCDNLHFYYDFFSAYFDLSKIPFIDPPDLNYLPPGGITETYHRMPSTCPACSLVTAPTQLRQRR